MVKKPTGDHNNLTDDASEFFTSRAELFRRLDEESDVLRNPAIRNAFQAIDRADFVGSDYRVESYEDYPLPIGFDQTISQPTTVAFMLELLGASEGETILDVGSGSGFTTALLASIVGGDGSVLGLEIVPELVTQGKKNLAKYNFPQAEIRQATNEYSEASETYDRILVNASAEEVPQNLLADLKVGGVMVIPVNESIVRIEKLSDEDVETQEFPGFTFVPLR